MKRSINSLYSCTPAYYSPNLDNITSLPQDVFVRIISNNYQQYSQYRLISKSWNQILTNPSTLSALTHIFASNLSCGAYRAQIWKASEKLIRALFLDKDLGVGAINSPYRNLTFSRFDQERRLRFVLDEKPRAAKYYQGKLYFLLDDGVYSITCKSYSNPELILEFELRADDSYRVLSIHNDKLYVLSDAGRSPLVLFIENLKKCDMIEGKFINDDKAFNIALKPHQSFNGRIHSSYLEPFAFKNFLIRLNNYSFHIEIINVTNGNVISVKVDDTDSVTTMAGIGNTLIIGYFSGTLATLEFTSEDLILEDSYKIFHYSSESGNFDQAISSINVDDGGHAIIVRRNGLVEVWDMREVEPKLISKLDELITNFGNNPIYNPHVVAVNYDIQSKLLLKSLPDLEKGWVEALLFDQDLPSIVSDIGREFLQSSTIPAAEKRFLRLPSFVKESIRQDLNKVWSEISAIEKGLALYKYYLNHNIEKKQKFINILQRKLESKENFVQLWEKATILQKWEAINESFSS